MSHLANKDTEDKTFSDLQISRTLINQCSKLGIHRPTPVQFNCIPRILKGEDCVCCSKTGSGKTLAFALPILHVLNHDPYGVFALVLSPTRELATQIAEQFQAVGKILELKVSLVIGGGEWSKQAQELELRPHVVIATPGQLCSQVQNNSNLKNIFKRLKFMVLDEADMLLNGGYDEHLDPILSMMPQKKQTLLFTATISDGIQELMRISPRRPFFYEFKDRVVTVSELDQRYVLCPYDAKETYLVQVLLSYLDKFKENNMIIFSCTRKRAQEVFFMIKELGFDCRVLHSLISQKERMSSMNDFKNSVSKILVTTDIACRGLDIPEVNLVVNFDVPSERQYVHRVGRTARAGRPGMAITLVTQYDINKVKAIEASIKTKLKEFKTNDSVTLKLLNQVNLAKQESQVAVELLEMDKKRDERKSAPSFASLEKQEERKAKKKKLK